MEGFSVGGCIRDDINKFEFIQLLLPVDIPVPDSEAEVAENIPHLDLQMCILRLIGKVGGCLLQ